MPGSFIKLTQAFVSYSLAILMALERQSVHVKNVRTLSTC